MAYSKQTWTDSPSTTTPLSAARLSHMEDGIEAAASTADGAAQKASNLSDLTSAPTARTNLGLGTAATAASTDFATAAQGAKADTAVQPGDLGAKVTAGTTAPSSPAAGDVWIDTTP